MKIMKLRRLKGNKIGITGKEIRRVLVKALFFVFCIVWFYVGVRFMVEGDMIYENSSIAYIIADEKPEGNSKEIKLINGETKNVENEGVMIVPWDFPLGYNKENDCLVMPIGSVVMAWRLVVYWVVVVITGIFGLLSIRKGKLGFMTIFFLLNVPVVASMDRGYLGRNLLILILIGLYFIYLLYRVVRLILKKKKVRN